jgi:hypothetical protein
MAYNEVRGLYLVQNRAINIEGISSYYLARYLSLDSSALCTIHICPLRIIRFWGEKTHNAKKQVEEERYVL